MSGFGWFLLGVIAATLVWAIRSPRSDGECEAYTKGWRHGMEEGISLAGEHRKIAPVKEATPEEIAAARALITSAESKDANRLGYNCFGIGCGECPISSACKDSDSTLTNAEEAAAARAWLAERGLPVEEPAK